MSDESSFFERKILSWLHTPGTYDTDHEEHEYEHRDNIWSDLHLFDNEWVLIQNRLEWRFLAYPINRFFKWAFVKYIGEELIDRDGEYARERTTEYFQYLRKYHGEEPTQTKTRQAEFKPVPEEGIFFQ